MYPRWLFLSLIPVAGILAQQIPADTNATTDVSDPFHIKTTVVVTATRTETDLTNSPVSTTLIEREELQNRNIQIIDRALELAEGVYPVRAKGPSDTLAGVGMRGFSGRGAAQSRTLVLLDGQPINSAYTGGVEWTSLPVNEIERMEVVRGPFSALYGGNAMGGVVNLITRPFERRQLEMEGEYGSHDTFIYSGRYSDRFFDRLVVTLGYRRLQSGGYQNYPVLRSARDSTPTAGTPVTGVTPWLTPTGSQTYQVGMRGQNGWNQHSYRGRAQYSISPSTAVSFQVLYHTRQYVYDQGTTDIQDSAGQPVFTGPIVFEHTGVWQRASLTNYNFLNGPGGGESLFVQGQFHHSFSPDTHLQVIGGLLDNPSDWYVTPSSASTIAGGGSGKLASRPSRGYYGNTQLGLRPWTIHNIVFGAESRHNNTDGAEYELANYAFRDARGEQLTSAFGNAFNQAFYLQDQITVSSRFQVVLGGRYDYWKSYDGVSTPDLGAETEVYPERSTHSLSGKLAALYRLTDSTTVYGNLGNAFRSPTVFELYRTYRLSSGNLYVANPYLDPERMFSWEGGLRQRIGSRVRLNAAFFENYITDLIYRTTDLDTDPSGKTRPLINAAEGFTRGFEFGSAVRLKPWLTFRTTYTYNNAIIEKNLATPATDGKRIPYVPKHMGSFGLLGSNKGVSGSITGQYVGSAPRNDVNDDVVNGVPGSYDPFFEIDLALSYRINQRVTVFGSMDDMLDRRYYIYYQNPGRVASMGLRFNLL